jgi:hypothetical protein
MQKRFESVANPATGQAIAGASVQVNVAGGAIATIYSDDGVTTRANPIITDANGYFEYFAADGLYDWVISGTGLTTRTIEDVLHESATDGVLLPNADSANPLMLDWYQEGLWTPELTFVTPGNLTTVKDASSFGTFTRIGRRVFCDMFVYYTTFTHTSASGSAKITGLPFTCKADEVGHGTLRVSGGNLNASYRGIFAVVGGGNNYMSPYSQLTGGDGPLSISDFPTGSYKFVGATFAYNAA